MHWNVENTAKWKDSKTVTWSKGIERQGPVLRHRDRLKKRAYALSPNASTASTCVAPIIPTLDNRMSPGGRNKATRENNRDPQAYPPRLQDFPRWNSRKRQESLQRWLRVFISALKGKSAIICASSRLSTFNIFPRSSSRALLHSSDARARLLREACSRLRLRLGAKVLGPRQKFHRLGEIMFISCIHDLIEIMYMSLAHYLFKKWIGSLAHWFEIKCGSLCH